MLTPQEVSTHAFTKAAFGGYNMAMVDEFLDELSNLHIGEWRHSYRPERFGYSYCDGTQWGLEIQFSNGAKPFKSYGDNSYPYIFNKFQELLGIDVSAEDYEEEDNE